MISITLEKNDDIILQDINLAEFKLNCGELNIVFSEPTESPIVKKIDNLIVFEFDIDITEDLKKIADFCEDSEKAKTFTKKWLTGIRDIFETREINFTLSEMIVKKIGKIEFIMAFDPIPVRDILSELEIFWLRTDIHLTKPLEKFNFIK